MKKLTPTYSMTNLPLGMAAIVRIDHPQAGVLNNISGYLRPI